MERPCRSTSLAKWRSAIGSSEPSEQLVWPWMSARNSGCIKTYQSNFRFYVFTRFLKHFFLHVFYQIQNVLSFCIARVDYEVGVHFRDFCSPNGKAFESRLINERAGRETFSRVPKDAPCAFIFVGLGFHP